MSSSEGFNSFGHFIPSHMGQPSQQQLNALFEYQAQLKANVTAAAAVASAVRKITGRCIHCWTTILMTTSFEEIEFSLWPELSS